MYPQRKPVEPIIEELISDTNVGYTDLINIPSTIGAKTTKVFKIIETTSPGAITDLSVATITPTSITLTWTAPGDDGYLGKASTYTIK